MDGVAIGVQEYRCETAINPKTTFKGESVVVKMGKLQRTRFTDTPRTQKTLISLVVTQTGNFKRDTQIPKLSATKSQRVLNWALNHPRYHSFAKFLIWCDRIEQADNIPESMLFCVLLMFALFVSFFVSFLYLLFCFFKRKMQPITK